MDSYQYRGRTKRGEVMTGTIESASEQAVSEWLLSTGIAPISIRPKPVESLAMPAWLRRLQARGRIRLRDLLLFTRQMFTMVKAGVPMMQALAGIQKSSKNLAMIRVLGEVRAELERGVDLATGFSHQPKVFSEYYVSMVRIGEGSGQLEEIFRRLFDQLEFDSQINRKIKSAMRYPMFVLLAIAIAIGILSVVVIPVFADFFGKFGATLPLMTRILLGFSSFVRDYWWAILGAFGVVIYAFIAITSRGAGRYQWDKHKLRIPIAGGIIQKATLARFCRGLATASKSGVPLVQAYTLVSRVVDNAFFEERILEMRSAIERGESMLNAAQVSGLFTPLELQMLAVGEETGDVDGMLSQVADIYQEEVEYEIGRLSDSIQPILITVMGALVLILLLGIFLPMWQIGSTIRGAMGQPPG